MHEDKKGLYFYMMIGYVGIFLIGLAGMRFASVYLDSEGFGLSLFGFLMVGVYLNFLEQKLGIKRKDFIISKVVLLVVFAILSFLLYVK